MGYKMTGLTKIWTQPHRFVCRHTSCCIRDAQMLHYASISVSYSQCVILAKKRQAMWSSYQCLGNDFILECVKEWNILCDVSTLIIHATFFSFRGKEEAQKIPIKGEKISANLYSHKRKKYSGQKGGQFQVERYLDTLLVLWQVRLGIVSSEHMRNQSSHGKGELNLYKFPWLEVKQVCLGTTWGMKIRPMLVYQKRFPLIYQVNWMLFCNCGR